MANLSYKEQLEHPLWKEKRLEILRRDGFKCSECPLVADETQLDVHHRYYLPNTMAWEYDNIVLITLCTKCHKLEEDALTHQSETLIEIFRQCGANSKQIAELRYYFVVIFNAEQIIQILHEWVEAEYRKTHPVKVQNLFGDPMTDG